MQPVVFVMTSMLPLMPVVINITEHPHKNIYRTEYPYILSRGMEMTSMLYLRGGLQKKLFRARNLQYHYRKFPYLPKTAFPTSRENQKSMLKNTIRTICVTRPQKVRL